MFTFQDDELEVNIDARKIDGTVDVCCFILADKDIKNYTNSNMHPDFEGHTFDITKGDILAVAQDRTFYAEKLQDDLKKIPSIFLIVANENENAKEIEYEAQPGKIVIHLKKDMFTRYKYIRQDQGLQSVLSGLVIVPVLTDLLADIKANESEVESDYAEYRWYRVLKKRLAEIGYDIKSDAYKNETAFILVQKLIDDPIGEAFISMEDLIQED